MNPKAKRHPIYQSDRVELYLMFCETASKILPPNPRTLPRRYELPLAPSLTFPAWVKIVVRVETPRYERDGCKVGSGEERNTNY